jgi:23S rRNA (pseudouridine1915-N3)-methyltransferase
MDLVVAAVGKPRRGSPVGEAIAEYERRTGRYFRFRVVEVPEASLRDEEAARAREQEGDALLRAVPENLQLWALTRAGTALTSVSLAKRLEDLGTYGHAGVAILIGGAHGLSEQVLARAGLRVSLSSMTLTHEMARLVLAEQLYRAGTISRGQPCHKGT